jgi:hypothetical protein
MGCEAVLSPASLKRAKRSGGQLRHNLQSALPRGPAGGLRCLRRRGAPETRFAVWQTFCLAEGKAANKLVFADYGIAGKLFGNSQEAVYMKWAEFSIFRKIITVLHLADAIAMLFMSFSVIFGYEGNRLLWALSSAANFPLMCLVLHFASRDRKLLSEKGLKNQNDKE